MNDIEILRLKSQGYCCSQIMVLLVLDLLDRENKELVNFTRGLCMGSGLEEGNCGILTGGLCILAMYAPEDADLRASMQSAYIDLFTSPSRGNTCKAIAGDYYPNLNPETCGSLLVQANEGLMAILVENGIDPSDLDDD